MYNNTTAQSESNFYTISALVIIFVSTALWINIYLNIHMDTDTGWLLQCLERFLSGGNYSTDFYETNPPLSFLIYLPAYPLYITGLVHAKTAILLVFLSYIFIANILLYYLLRQIPLNKMQAISLVACLVISQTWMSGVNFGSKDHLIYICLLPYCIYQVLILQGQTVHKPTTTLVSLLAGLALCIKPHYAIIPALFAVQRLVRNKSLYKTMLSRDFIIIALVIFAFALFYALRFPDFFTIILSDLREIYSNESRFDITNYLSFLSLPFMALLCFGLLPDDNESYNRLKPVIYNLALLSFVLFVPFAVQGKGFEYQAIPFIGTGLIVLLFSLFCLLTYHIKQPLLVLTLIFSLSISLLTKLNTGKNKDLMNSEEFVSLPYHQKLEEYAWNNVYASYEFHSLVLALPYYTDLKNGSRFGQLWPISGLSQKLQQNHLPEKERLKVQEKMRHYISMLAQDIDRYKPSVISIPQYYDPENNGPSKKYLDFLLSNPEFKEKMRSYDFVERVDFDKSLIVVGIKEEKDKILSFDLFQRRKD
ncbi:MAG: hypothetical protein OEY94_01980 [Alphaproteobacteria bacterium]|nr:hypothetical protein [Alphaproteobacteria bacterium]